MNLDQRSIRNQIRSLFIVLLLIAITLISSIAFYYWKISIDDMVLKVQEEANANILTKLDNFIDVPLSMNQKSQYFITAGLVDIKNITMREKFFAAVMKSAAANVYSFSYGTAQGEYYGVRRSAEGKLEFMKSDSATKGRSEYYTVNEDLTAGPLSLQLGVFDPRSRDWYKEAADAAKPTFSDIYKHFIMNDLALSASYPIYQNGQLQGVMGTHITLSALNELLKAAVNNKKAIAYILEKASGELVANTAGELNFRVDKEGAIDRIDVEENTNPLVKDAFKQYKESGLSSYEKDTPQGKFHIKITELQRTGLDWLVVTIVPEYLYMVEIEKSIIISVVLSAIIVIAAILLWAKKIDKYMRPIYDLISVTEQFSQGDFSCRANISTKNEIGKLGHAFNNMAEEISGLINNLEKKVTERTKELEKRNLELAKAQSQLELSAQVDFLTGLYNRKFMISRLEEAISNFHSKTEDFSVVMMDIDYFKKVNDQYGHDCGDFILKETARLLKQNIRKSDFVARWGGEEFLLLLSYTTLNEALQAAEKLRSSMEGHLFTCKDWNIRVTATFGIAVYSQDMDVDGVIKNADIALYNGKRSGRNQVHVYTG